MVERPSVQESVSSQPTGAAYFSWISNLTPKETQVLEFLCQGLLQKQIAQELVITTKTVKGHCSKIYRKLGVKNKGECLIRCAPLVGQHRKQTKVEKVIGELQDLSGKVESIEQRQAIEAAIRILRMLAGLSEF